MLRNYTSVLSDVDHYLRGLITVLHFGSGHIPFFLWDSYYAGLLFTVFYFAISGECWNRNGAKFEYKATNIKIKH
jgi:hypothetical protein